MTVRCSYQWAIVAKPQARTVLRYVQCRNRTTDESGRCWRHRDAHSGRYDRRPA